MIISGLCLRKHHTGSVGVCVVVVLMATLHTHKHLVKAHAVKSACRCAEQNGSHTNAIFISYLALSGLSEGSFTHTNTRCNLTLQTDISRYIL